MHWHPPAHRRGSGFRCARARVVNRDLGPDGIAAAVRGQRDALEGTRVRLSPSFGGRSPPAIDRCWVPSQPQGSAPMNGRSYGRGGTNVIVGVTFLSSIVDLPRHVHLGPATGLAAATVLGGTLVWMTWSLRPAIPRAAARAIAPMLAFLAWATISMLWAPLSLEGAQNLAVLLTFAGSVLLSARQVNRDPLYHRRLRRAFEVATLASCGLYAGSVVLDGLGSYLFTAPRSFALFALVCMSWYLAEWRSGRAMALPKALLILLLIGASLSRLALGAAVALFCLCQMDLRRPRDIMRLAASLVIVLALAATIFETVAPLRERFLTGDTSMEVAGFAINASGRTAIWAVTLRSAAESPWIGKGVGSAEQVVVSHFQTIGHPHSDYLRILHDTGCIGLLLWSAGYLVLLFATYRAWKRGCAAGHPDRQLHQAAFLVAVAIALGMATDNVMVYSFAMAPFGIVLGASLGRAGPARPVTPRVAPPSWRLADDVEAPHAS